MRAGAGLLAAVCTLALIIVGCSPDPVAPETPKTQAPEIPSSPTTPAAETMETLETLAPERPSSLPDPAAPETPGTQVPEIPSVLPTPAAATATTAVNKILTPTPIPQGRICNRTKSAQRAILLELGMKSCRQPVMEDLGKIKKLRIARGPIIKGDLEGMNNLAKLEIVDLEISLGHNALPSMPELRELTIQTREPETGMRSPNTILTPGIFRRLPRLERLQVTGENGWKEENLTAELISGMPLLRRLELDYIKSIEPDALSQTPLLEYLRIHGAESWEDFAPRVPRKLFAELNWIEHVEVRNFRWPPVLDVKSQEAACRTRGWRSFANPEGRVGEAPLSVLIQGKYNEPRDLESLTGCP